MHRLRKDGRVALLSAFLSVLFWGTAVRLAAEDLAPRAYIITPVHSNAVTITSTFFSGGINLNGAVPITGATGKYYVPVLSYYHSFSFFGRSANFTASLPYAVGKFSGNVLGNQTSPYRSGLLDASFRFAVNLKGGPAMETSRFVKWTQKTIIGVSVKVVVPTGQYDPKRLVNWGVNRWAVKTEFGYSRRFRHWLFDAYGGAWFYTENPSTFNVPVPLPQVERPIVCLESHLSYDFKPRTWLSLDGNFWSGGTTSSKGIEAPATKQAGSRLGVTGSLPLWKHQSLKVSYSGGTYVRFGGNYHSLSIAWQYSWIGKLL